MTPSYLIFMIHDMKKGQQQNGGFKQHLWTTESINWHPMPLPNVKMDGHHALTLYQV